MNQIGQDGPDGLDGPNRPDGPNEPDGPNGPNEPLGPSQHTLVVANKISRGHGSQRFMLLMSGLNP